MRVFHHLPLHGSNKPRLSYTLSTSRITATVLPDKGQEAAFNSTGHDRNLKVPTTRQLNVRLLDFKEKDFKEFLEGELFNLV